VARGCDRRASARVSRWTPGLLYLLYTSGTTAKPGIAPAAGWSASRRRTTTSSTSSPTRCTGAQPTWAGSPGTATSSTARSATGRRA
jgi:acyl-coenzyme A synthetase/AMP-(fatty) acid ligase